MGYKEKECEYCHKAFTPDYPNQNTCCHEHARAIETQKQRERRQAERAANPPAWAKPKECLWCHEIFTPRHKHQICCCEAHTKKLYRKEHADTKTCPICGQAFKPARSTQVTCCAPECIRGYKNSNRDKYETHTRPQGFFSLDADPYKTGALRSDAMYCPFL